MAVKKGAQNVKFQSTHSVRRATNLPPYIDERYLISIHALRKESDFLHQAVDQHQTYFNPRSP